MCVYVWGVGREEDEEGTKKGRRRKREKNGRRGGGAKGYIRKHYDLGIIPI